MDSLCPEDKPCHAMPVGAFLLTWGLYLAAFPRVFFGENFADAVQNIDAGHIVNMEGLCLALLVGGIVLLFIGVRAALSHDDPVRVGSLLGSIAIVVLCLWGIGNGMYAAGPGSLNWHVSRAAWLSFLALGVACIWLETRGMFRRRRDRRRAYAPVVQEPSSFSFRRRTIEITEWTGGHDPVAQQPEFQHWQAPPAIGQRQAVPQIVYVPDENGELIPMRIDAPRVIERRQ
jgi:hypothetical protein